jgi:GTP-binding protein HflX
MSAEKALLVQVLFRGRRLRTPADSLDELGRLALTSGAQVVGTVTQDIDRPAAATLIGSGKLELLVEAVKGLEADVVIFDNELSPVQNRNLEKALAVKVLDRTGLILDIFALRARTSEGKMQVELAQLSYLKPRLTGHGVLLSRLGGGIGTRGPGETKLEMDRRRVEEKIQRIRERLRKVRRTRALHRAGRSQHGVPLVVLVGYTNAGKSSLLNALTGAGVYVKDQLFATLDPTHRRLRLPTGETILLADTVGFIRNLPHQLVEAFRATLEEVASADLLLHVIDAGRPRATDQEEAVLTVLGEIGAAERPVLRVLNKVDLVDGRPAACDPLDTDGDACLADGLRVSAKTGQGIPDLLAAIREKLALARVHATYRVPAADGRTLADLYRSGRVLFRRERGDTLEVEVELDERSADRLRAYRVNG